MGGFFRVEWKRVRDRVEKSGVVVKIGIYFGGVVCV